MPKQILIAGNQQGLRDDIKPFLLPDGAYPILENAFIFRQRLKKKPGHISLGRLRRQLTAIAQNNTDGTGTYNDPDLLDSVRGTEPNAEIEKSSVTFRIDPGGGSETIYTDDGAGNVTRTSGPFTISSGSINYVTGALSLTFTLSPPVLTTNADFRYFPALPGVGVCTQEVAALNFEDYIALDTKYAYLSSATGWFEYTPLSGTTWTGASQNLFWCTNYRGAVPQTPNLWSTNNIDPIRFSDGATWTDFTPDLVSGGGAPTLDAALLITPFKGRLLVFSTTESGTATPFRQRCRFSQSALVGAPTAADAWETDTPGKGGFVDAATSEAIVSLRHFKDRLLIYFERSTWELVYTGNETLPFYFRQINSELGTESTFSTLQFDEGVLGIGKTGVHASDGVGVKRIDPEIPNKIYDIQNINDGLLRVATGRDFIQELVYWTYPDKSAYDQDNDNQVFPNRVLIYNYRDGTWAIWKESFTVYGEYQKQSDFTWATLPYLTWGAWDVPWNEALTQQGSPDVLALNQQGYTFLLDGTTSENAVSLAIRDFPAADRIESPDHNLETDDYFTISGVLGTTITPAPLIPPDNIPRVYKVEEVIDANTIRFDGTASGTYLGCGEITVLSNFCIFSKTFNSFFPNSKAMRLLYVDYNFNRTTQGAFSSLFYINDNQVIPNDAFMGTNEVPTIADPERPITASQDTIWYRKFTNVVGSFIQFKLTMSDAQMQDSRIAQSPWTLNAAVLNVEPEGRLAP